MDSMKLAEVKKWVKLACRVYDLTGFTILESSQDSYHVLFDDTVTWSRNVSIMAGLALISKNEPYVTWVLLQCRNGCSTLRISAKGEKPTPRMVYPWGNQFNEIKQVSKITRPIRIIPLVRAHLLIISSLFLLTEKSPALIFILFEVTLMSNEY